MDELLIAAIKKLLEDEHNGLLSQDDFTLRINMLTAEYNGAATIASADTVYLAIGTDDLNSSESPLLMDVILGEDNVLARITLTQQQYERAKQAGIEEF